ncbi:MAG: hypothetical protein Kow0062_02140 [Acidobacteriota bacterium]
MVRYREEQPLGGNPVLHVLIGVAVIVPTALVTGLALSGSPLPFAQVLAILAPALLVLVALMAFLSVCRLVVEVHDDGVHVRFAPFHRRPRRFAPDEIADVVVRDYRPLREYGGWGIRIASGGRRAYTVSGTRGCELVLRDGRRIMIGSRQPERLAAAIGAVLARGGADDRRSPR